jgi:DNA-3-methyladenine glycosylase I
VHGTLRLGDDGRARCWWCGDDPTYVAYHDREWGRPTTDETELFELLCLEGAQAGLSWITVLRKRDAYRRAFAGFDPEVVAGFGPDDVARLLADAGIIRNRLKIDAAIGNARALLALHEAGGSLAELVWSHGPPPRARRRRPGVDEIPAVTPEAEALSKVLKRQGFRFVGPTIVYAYLQSAGVVDDHLDGCWVDVGSPPPPDAGGDG